MPSAGIKTLIDFPEKRDIAAQSEAEKRLLESEAALQKALEEIKKSENKLRQVIDTIPALAWCNLPDGVFPPKNRTAGAGKLHSIQRTCRP